MAQTVGRGLCKGACGVLLKLDAETERRNLNPSWEFLIEKNDAHLGANRDLLTRA